MSDRTPPDWSRAVQGRDLSRRAQQILDAEIVAERERVAKDQQERQEAVQRLRNRVAPTLAEGARPQLELPPDNVPLHETPRADGLAVDTSIGLYALKRLSPFRNRWPEVLEFDARAARLEQRQADTNTEIVASQQQLVQARAEDAEAMARWVADSVGERPLPTAPAIERRIADLIAERDAHMLAVQHVLDEKALYVGKHRGRLSREAAKARALAVEHLQAAISAVEAARVEAVECVVAQRWADAYPGEKASASNLRLVEMKGGRLSTALPDFKGLAVASQVVEWLRDDARWLNTVLERERQKRDELDPHFKPIWEETEEGRKAIALANKRIAAGLKPRHTREAGWGD